MNDQHTARAGTLITVEWGSYSDHVVEGFFVVLSDFSPSDKLDEYLGPRKECEPEEFLAYLLACGLLLEVCHGTLHLGEWGSGNGREDLEFTPMYQRTENN